MSAHKPTSEQQQVIDAFGAGSTIVVEAGAGCGKSTTLKMAAQTRTQAKGIYIAYNRALADEAKRTFPPSVWCKTAHGLAFGPVGKRYAHRLNGPRLPAREVARILKINDPTKISSTVPLIAPQQLARLVMDAVARYCNSADAQVEWWHVSRITGLQEAEMRILRDVVVPLARKAWDDLSSVDGQLKFTHDCYLKLYQLSDPKLSCDFLLLDEAQDASPVMASIFDRQTNMQRIMVGDASQAIYGWRGAVDAMSKFEADQRLTLSQSFRFGQAVADEANKWLSILAAPIRLTGFDRVPSRLAALAEPDAVLCRTNGEAVAQLMQATNAGRRAALVGGGNDIRRLAEAAVTLKEGRGTEHPELFMFQTWGEVQDYVEHDNAGSDLRVFVRLIDSHGPEVVIATVDRLVSEDRADVVVSTAHKAKGREWETVRIAADFREPKVTEDNPEPELPRDDAMLAYVAVTRAQIVLDRDGLSWVDRWVPGAVRSLHITPAVVLGESDEDGPHTVDCAVWGTELPCDCADAPTELPAVPDLPAHVSHCVRCGSPRCLCDPTTQRRWYELAQLPRPGRPAVPAEEVAQ
jgi:AAA domain/UvrD-like helicase C-terminal domain